MEHVLLGMILSCLIVFTFGHNPEKHPGDECELVNTGIKNTCGAPELECVKSHCHCRPCAQLNNVEDYWEKCHICLEAAQTSCNSTKTCEQYAVCKKGQDCECVSYCRKEKVEVEESEILLGAKAALVIGVILGLATVFAFCWKYWTRKQHAERCHFPRNDHSTTSMSSIQRIVLAKLRNRPPAYDDEEHIKQERPPSYEESISVASPMTEHVIAPSTAPYPTADTSENVTVTGKEMIFIPDNSCSYQVIDITIQQLQQQIHNYEEPNYRSMKSAHRMLGKDDDDDDNSVSYSEEIVEHELHQTALRDEDGSDSEPQYSEKVDVIVHEPIIKDENIVEVSLKFGVQEEEGDA